MDSLGIPQNRTLVPDPRYRGQYVAITSCNDNTVVASGSSWGEVRRDALSRGFNESVVVYVPNEYCVHCLHARK
jgi:hypothetical protein